jgi:hypothetical protein
MTVVQIINTKMQRGFIIVSQKEAAVMEFYNTGSVHVPGI